MERYDVDLRLINMPKYSGKMELEDIEARFTERYLEGEGEEEEEDDMINEHGGITLTGAADLFDSKPRKNRRNKGTRGVT